MTAKVLLLFVFVLSRQAFAIGGFLSGGVGGEGTNLSTLTGRQDYDVPAGGGWFVTAGVLLPVSATEPHRFEAQIGLGYLTEADTNKNSNAVTWTRYTLEAIYYYRNTQEQFRFGWGPIFHFHNEILGKGSNSSASTPVDNALGWTIAVEKIVDPPKSDLIGFGLRYNFIKYRSDSFSHEADGNSMVVTTTLLIP